MLRPNTPIFVILIFNLSPVGLKKMRKLIVTILLIFCCSCGSIKGQLYVDVNENVDFEQGEDLRYRTRFKIGYKIYLGEKHTLIKQRNGKERKRN